MHKILLGFLFTEIAASDAVTPQILLNQQISLLLPDSNRDLLRVSCQRTFKHDVHTYSHIICVYFTSVYIYFYKNDTMHAFYGECIVIFFWRSPTPLLCFAFPCDTGEQSACFCRSQADPELQPCFQVQGLSQPCQVASSLHLALPNYKVITLCPPDTI